MSVYLLVAGRPAVVRGAFASRERTLEAAQTILSPGEAYRVQEWILDYPITERSEWYAVPPRSGGS